MITLRWLPNEHITVEGREPKMKKYSLIFICLSLLTACTVGPDFKRPDTRIKPEQVFLHAPEKESFESMGNWWQRIDDPLFARYVDQLLKQNLDLKQAGARVLQARARLGLQKGSYSPSLRLNTSSWRNFMPVASAAGSRQYATNYTAELESSWELDLFGRIRNSVSAADANFLASVYDQQALTQSLITQLLRSRIAIAVNQRLLSLAEQNAKNRKQILDLVSNRYDLGAANASLEDVLLAEENYSSVIADVNEFRRRLTDETYAFDILLGEIPGTTKLSTIEFPVLPAPLDVAVCLPAHLLDRRPDLRANELRLKAANADIGVAIADLYPTLNLVASVGVTGETTNNLFSSEQLTGSIISSLVTRIFEGGALRANIKLQKAEAEELAYSYAQNVLTAIQEVESALQAEKELAGEIESLNRSVASLKHAENISEERYRKGILSLRDFLNTQQRRYQIEQNAITREQQKWNTRTNLYLALGGDWLSHDTPQDTCP